MCKLQNILKQVKRGRLFLHGQKLDLKLQSYLKAVCLRVGRITFALTIAIKQVLIKSNYGYNLNMLGLTSSF